MTDRDEKKARFAQQSRVAGSRKAVVAGVCAVLLVAAGATYLLAPNGDANSDRSKIGGSQTVEASRPVRLNATPVKATAEGGNLSISMADLKKKGFVEFAYARANDEVPLLAYVTKDGGITAAVRLCEPCRSKAFHIESDELVCNACGTRWKLSGLSGISGGCMAYPPEKLTATAKAGRLVIPEAQLVTWKPRV